jgi:hypothetical protein
MTDHDDEELQELGETAHAGASAAPPTLSEDQRLLAEERATTAHLQMKINRARDALRQGKPTHALDILT